MDFDMENFDKLRLANERLRKKVRELESAPPEVVQHTIKNVGSMAAWLVIDGEKVYIAPGESFAPSPPLRSQEKP